MNDDNANITDLPGHGVEHLFFWNDDPKQCFPPHLGVGLSHTRSLRCCPCPQGLALQSDHIDQVDQPPVTNHKNIAISLWISNFFHIITDYVVLYNDRGIYNLPTTESLAGGLNR